MGHGSNGRGSQARTWDVLKRVSSWIDVVTEDELPAGGVHVVDLEDIEVAVFNIAGQYYAIEDVCTHDGTPLTHGQSMDGGEIECPRHGARFCIRTGEALSAPAWEATKKFQLRIEGKNILFLDDRWD